MKRFDNLSPGVNRPTDRWPSGSGFIIKQKAQAENSSPEPFEKTGGTIAEADPAKTDNRESSPIPHGYRDWRLISVAHEEGDLNELRAALDHSAELAKALSSIAQKGHNEHAPFVPHAIEYLTHRQAFAANMLVTG